MTGVVELALFTDDVPALRAFYERLLGGPHRRPSGLAARSSPGAVKLLVHVRSAPEESGPPNENHVAIASAEVDAASEALRADGVELLVAPRDFPWGRSAYLRDPDGRLVELSQA